MIKLTLPEFASSNEYVVVNNADAAMGDQFLTEFSTMTTTQTENKSELEEDEVDKAFQSVTVEKSLTQILRKSWRLECSWQNAVGFLVVALPLAFYACLGKVKDNDLNALTRSLADYSFGFAASILGFLLAGFTIFATLSRPKMFVEMAKHPHKSSASNHLKFNFFSIMNTFIAFMGLVMVCVIIKLFAFPAGPLVAISHALPIKIEAVADMWLARAGFIILGSLLWACAYMLKSFVFNIYHIVMTQVGWDIINEDDV